MLLFWIEMVQKREINLDLKTSTEEFVSSKEAFGQEKGICYHLKWMQNNYRIGFILLLDQRRVRWRNCKESTMNSEEHGRNSQTLMQI